MRDLSLIQWKTSLPYSHSERSHNIWWQWLDASTTQSSLTAFAVPLHGVDIQANLSLFCMDLSNTVDEQREVTTWAFQKCLSSWTMLPEASGPNGQINAYLWKPASSSSQTQPKDSVPQNHILTANSALAKTKVLTRTDPITPWIKVSIVPSSGEEMSGKLDWHKVL